MDTTTANTATHSNFHQSDRQRTHFPKRMRLPNPCAFPVHATIYHMKRECKQSIAYVPNAFDPVVFNIDGDCYLGNKMTIRDVQHNTLLSVWSENSGFHIVDHRHDSAYVMSRNGHFLFLYEKLGQGSKCPVAVVKPKNSFLWKKAAVFVTDSCRKIGSMRKKWAWIHNFLCGCTSHEVRAEPGYDLVMMIALQLCYECLER